MSSVGAMEGVEQNQQGPQAEEGREYTLKQPIKIGTPETFTGERTKLQVWLTQIELYIMVNEDKFDNEAAKVVFAASYMWGAAFEWFSTYLQDYIEHSDNLTTAKLETRRTFHHFNNFKTLITQTFGDIDEERTAERKLLSLKQTGSAANYAAEFQRWATRTRWDAAAQIAKFYQGLKDPIKDEVSRTERPTTFKAMVELATRIDNRQYERQLEKKGRTPFSYYPKRENG